MLLMRVVVGTHVRDCGDDALCVQALVMGGVDPKEPPMRDPGEIEGVEVTG